MKSLPVPGVTLVFLRAFAPPRAPETGRHPVEILCRRNLEMSGRAPHTDVRFYLRKSLIAPPRRLLFTELACGRLGRKLSKSS